MLPYRSSLVSTAQTLLNVVPYTFGFFHEKEHLSISLFEQYEELSVSNYVFLFLIWRDLFYYTLDQNSENLLKYILCCFNNFFRIESKTYCRKKGM